MKIIKSVIYIILIVSMSNAHASFNDKEKQSIMSSISKKIEVKYVDEDKIKNILSSLKKLSNTPKYENIVSPMAYSKLITSELRKIDKHFALQWSDNNFQSIAKSTK